MAKYFTRLPDNLYTECSIVELTQEKKEMAKQYSKHRDSKNDWRDSCEIKMNNLEFSQLLTNLKNII